MAGYKSKLGKLDAKGNFRWDLGKHATGKPQRFYLGQSPELAGTRMERLEALWEAIESQAEVPAAAVWTDGTLQIAKAIARGENSVRLSPPLPFDGSELDYRTCVHFVDLHARRFPLISVVPADVEAYRKGQEIVLGMQRDVVRVGQELFGEPNILEMEVAMLHDAMDAYNEAMRAEHVDPDTRKPTAYGNNLVRQTKLLKERHDNIMLGQLTLGAIKVSVRRGHS